MTNYFTQIRETEDGKFVVFDGFNPDALKQVCIEDSFKEASATRAGLMADMKTPEVKCYNHGFVPRVAMQGKIAGH